MSITLGIYDVFAYTIPGLLYLYVGYETLVRLGLPRFSLSGLPTDYGWLIGMIGIAGAYILGHLMDALAQRIVFRLFKRTKFSEIVLKDLKQKYPDLEIEFQPSEWGMLLSILKNRNLERTIPMDTYEANCIMLRNISLGLLIVTILQIYDLSIKFSLTNLVIVIGALAFCLVARNRSRMFHTWFLMDIYQSSLDYGKSVKEVVAYADNWNNLKDISSKKEKPKVASTKVNEKS